MEVLFGSGGVEGQTFGADVCLFRRGVVSTPVEKSSVVVVERNLIVLVVVRRGRDGLLYKIEQERKGTLTCDMWRSVNHGTLPVASMGQQSSFREGKKPRTACDIG